MQRATRRVDVLSVQRLLGGLRALSVLHLNERLELVVLRERDDLEHGPEPREDRVDRVEAHRVEHVLDHGAQHRVCAACLRCSVQLFG